MQKIRCTAAHLAAISLLETKQLELDAALDMSFFLPLFLLNERETCASNGFTTLRDWQKKKYVW